MLFGEFDQTILDLIPLGSESETEDGFESKKKVMIMRMSSNSII